MPSPSSPSSPSVMSSMALLVFSCLLWGQPAEAQLQLDHHFFHHYLDNWLDLVNQTATALRPSYHLSAGANFSGGEGAHLLSLSLECYRDVVYLIESARERHPWALKIFDAMGKPSSGIMEASLSFLGNFGECVRTAAPEPHALFGQYCLANVHLPNSTISALQKLSGLSPAVLIKAHPRVGLCLPASCSLRDTALLGNTAISKLLPNTTLTLTNCHHQRDDFDEDQGARIALWVFASFSAVIILATLFDCFRIQEPSNMISWKGRPRTTTSIVSLTSSGADSGHEAHECDISILSEIFLSFSMKRNVAKIMDTESASQSIAVLHGIRFFSMVWIIGGHSYSFAMQWLFFRNPQNIQSAPKNIVSQVLANGTFSVDCFFFISGFLVAFLSFKEMKKARGKFNFLAYYVHRYFRMTPLMMAVIAFCATLLRYVGEGPAWSESITMFDDWCKKNWWLNALYVHNFVKREQMCLSHSWYSAVDMQLYAMAPLVLVPLYRRPKLGMVIMGALLAGSVAITGYLTITRHYPAVPYINDLVPQDLVNEYYGAIYIKPYCRIGPYLVGIALAFLFYFTDNKSCLKKSHSRIGWILTILVNCGVLFAMTSANQGNLPSDAWAALYSSTARTLWALGLAWITYACVTGNGGPVTAILSWKPWIPLSRLTYCAYLIHPIVMATFYGSRQTTFQFSHFLMLYLILGNVIITYAVSLVLSGMFESPFVALERLALRGRRRRR